MSSKLFFKLCSAIVILIFVILAAGTPKNATAAPISPSLGSLGSKATGSSCSYPLQSYWFEVTRNGSTFTVNDLRGRLALGDRVVVKFKIKSGCGNVQVSLVAYKAPSPTFSRTTADQQTVDNYQTR